MSQELPGPRSLEDAKAWMLDKLAARTHPMGLTDIAATREVIAGLGGLDGENWAAAWMSRGDAYAATAATAQTRGETAQARDAWYQAYAFYFLGRFPCPNHPEKQRSTTRSAAPGSCAIRGDTGTRTRSLIAAWSSTPPTCGQSRGLPGHKPGP